MPQYDYKCNHCNAEYSIQQAIQDQPVVKCPICLQETLERLISKTSFSLIGSGWFKDGYTTSTK